MDVSKEYIEMCGKAREIQKLRNPSEKDFVCEVGQPFEDDTTEIFGANYIWLPRQDQIQELLTKDGEEWYITFANFLTWFQFRFFRTDLIKSIDQLWLEYYMQTNFRKTWNGKEWVGK